MHQLFVAGLSYKTAPVALREKLAVPSSDHAAIGARLVREGHLEEVVLLWTCNRVEIYGVSEAFDGDVSAMLACLTDKPLNLASEIYVKRGHDAVAHLFGVTSGLDSMVLGETEITNQVKTAYEKAHAAGLTGKTLNRLFQKAFEASKVIRSTTAIGQGAASVGSVAVQHAQKIFGSAMGQKKIMIIGAGTMAEKCLKHLVKRGSAGITVVNRSVEKAEELAHTFGGTAVSFGRCLEAMVDVDIVITSTGCPHIILEQGDIASVMAHRPDRPLVLVDIAVPRDVDPQARTIPGVHLYDIDDLQGTVRESISHREKDLALCRSIIDARAADLLSQLHAAKTGGGRPNPILQPEMAVRQQTEVPMHTCDMNVTTRMSRASSSLRGAFAALAVTVLLSMGASNANADKVKLNYRPLTPQEIKDYGLTNTTQKCGGAPNAAIGTPIYFEALVSTQTVVNAVNWTLVSKPTNSAAALIASPLGTNVPTYDFGDRLTNIVAGRIVLTPDTAGNFYNGDYVVRADVILSNSTLSATSTVYGSVYLGMNHYLCVLCHAGMLQTFTNTLHATVFRRRISGVGVTSFTSNCIICHVTGYDTTPGATNGGFDDVAAQVGWQVPATLDPTNWLTMNTNLQNKANVQCEACHGPADRHMRGLGDTNAIDVSLSAGTCGQCHDSLTHHVKNFEWKQSMHATGFVFRSTGSCAPCHSTVGFINLHDPTYVTNNISVVGTGNEGITCQACHDPHEVGMGAYQLRNLPTATLSNGYVVAQGGEGTLCMNCHHSRQSANTYVTNSVISSFNVHFGTQGDMINGQNGIEYGLDMPRSRHLTAVSNSCVGCHMQVVTGTIFSAANTYAGEHTWAMTYGGGATNTNTFLNLTVVCSQCHVEQNTFNFGGEDYDHNGRVEGVQTEISNLLIRLGNLLPPIGNTNVIPDATYTLSQKKAAWNFFFVQADKSLGVHNPKYASALLWASIQDLQGGIDQDFDGLPDAWEIQNFGSITAYSGLDDPDGDGLNNLMEYKFGTNPNSADSDNDGYSDYAEVMAGSNPTNAASIPDPNTVMQMLPALELGYFPTNMGVTQQFQVVDGIANSGGWTNIGSSFISSNSLSYQLISLRGRTQVFFRVTKP